MWETPRDTWSFASDAAFARVSADRRMELGGRGRRFNSGRPDQSVSGFCSEEIGEYDYWSLCYGPLPKVDLQDRDRLDAIGDVLRGMIVMVITSAALLAWRAPRTALDMGVFGCFIYSLCPQRRLHLSGLLPQSSQFRRLHVRVPRSPSPRLHSMP